MRAALIGYDEGFDKVRDLVQNGTVKTPGEANVALTPYKDQIRTLEENARVFRLENLQGTSEQIAHQTARSTLTMSVLVAIATLLSLVLSVFFTRSVTIPLGEVVAAAERVARGDLRVNLTQNRGDELGRLQGAISEMLKSLTRVIGEIRNGAGALSSAAAQVSSTSQSLSQGTSEQAAAVEEVSSSLEEFSSGINQNAENAKRMEKMALQSAKDAGRRGRRGQGLGRRDERHRGPHRADRGNRLPDELARAERRHRSGARRRARSRLLRRRDGSTQARRAQPDCGEGDPFGRDIERRSGHTRGRSTRPARAEHPACHGLHSGSGGRLHASRLRASRR